MTPADILVCDVCRGPILELQRAMVFWEPDGAAAVSALHLSHKRCDRDDLGYSAELFWMATPDAALHKLADMALSYAWSGEQLKRLALIAWAVPRVATPKDRQAATEFLRFWG